MLELNLRHQNPLEEVCAVNNYIKYFKVTYLLRKFRMKVESTKAFYYSLYGKKISKCRVKNYKNQQAFAYLIYRNQLKTV